MKKSIERKIAFVVFFLLTVYLLYAHIQAKARYRNELKGLAEIVEGHGKQERIKLEDRYAVIQLKNRQGEMEDRATIINYTFDVRGKTYEGKIAFLGKSFDELVKDSTYYLPANPAINSVHPKEDYAHLEKEGMWNWRLYLGIFTALGVIGSLLPDKEKT
jgi:hypothetical protein